MGTVAGIGNAVGELLPQIEGHLKGSQVKHGVNFDVGAHVQGAGAS
jgi:hypothetical protein